MAVGCWMAATFRTPSLTAARSGPGAGAGSVVLAPGSRGAVVVDV
jgi:hypothetical protein